MKVVILGAASVGKTTLIHRYIDGRFQETISVSLTWKNYLQALPSVTYVNADAVKIVLVIDKVSSCLCT